MFKKLIIGFSALVLIACSGLYLLFLSVQKTLPEIIQVEDYKPLLVSQVYDRNNKKFGEFFRERRTLVPYSDIPKHVIDAFLAAEDDQFFQHKGINVQALLRAAIANMKAGRNVQGGSTITQSAFGKVGSTYGFDDGGERVRFAFAGMHHVERART